LFQFFGNGHFFTSRSRLERRMNHHKGNAGNCLVYICV
jgi:hypothetical protein